MSRFLIGLATVWLFAGGFGSIETTACGDPSTSQRDCKPCKRPDGSTNHFPNVTSLTLDKSDLQFKQASIDPETSAVQSSQDQIISVMTNAEDFENDVLDYTYTVTTGRIIGSGANVSWNLSGAMPGTYTITAKVDDSCGVCGKTITKTVRIIGKTPVVAAAPVSIPASKPTTVAATNVAPPTTAKAAKSVVIERPATTQSTRISVSSATAPAAVTSPVGSQASCPKILITDPERSGDELIFTTKIFDLATVGKLTYIWTVVGGSVVSQDARTIRVKPGVVGGSIKVSVNGLDPKGTCPNSAQKTF